MWVRIGQEVDFEPLGERRRAARTRQHARHNDKCGAIRGYAALEVEAGRHARRHDLRDQEMNHADRQLAGRDEHQDHDRDKPALAHGYRQPRCYQEGQGDDGGKVAQGGVPLEQIDEAGCQGSAG